MITDVDYLQLVSEAYDLSDYATKKKVLFCNEAKKVNNIENIVGRLYAHIKANIVGIDFGTIPKSKGVITRIENYAELIDCLNSIHDLVRTYSENTKVVDEMLTAISNIQKRERQFTKAFALNIDLPIMLYNTVVLSVVSGTSLLISSSVEFIKNGHDSFNVSFDKVGFNKSKDHVLYEYVSQFNKNCTNGSIDKLINDSIKNNIVAESADIEVVREFNVKDVLTFGADVAQFGTGYTMATKVSDVIKNSKNLPTAIKVPIHIITTIVGCGIAIVALFTILRKAIYVIFRARMAFSDWLDLQSTYLRINAENLIYRDSDTSNNSKEVYQRQIKYADKLKKLSNAIALKDAKARKDADDYERSEQHRQYDDDDDSDGGLF